MYNCVYPFWTVLFVVCTFLHFNAFTGNIHSKSARSEETTTEIQWCLFITICWTHLSVDTVGYSIQHYLTWYVYHFQFLFNWLIFPRLLQVRPSPFQLFFWRTLRDCWCKRFFTGWMSFLSDKQCKGMSRIFCWEGQDWTTEGWERGGVLGEGAATPSPPDRGSEGA